MYFWTMDIIFKAQRRIEPKKKIISDYTPKAITTKASSLIAKPYTDKVLSKKIKTSKKSIGELSFKVLPKLTTFKTLR